jgi:hypothetical protein
MPESPRTTVAARNCRTADSSVGCDESSRLERARVSRVPPLPDLLERAGFRVRSATRADCVCPGGSRMTIAFRGDLYFCHRCHRKGSRESLARAMGLLATDRESLARRRKEACESAKLRSVAGRLRATERRVLVRARANLLNLVALRRNAGARLAALHAGGAPERFPGETELAWAALRFMADHELRASASYLVAAFASEKDRAIFALRPGQRMPMVNRVIDQGGLLADRGRWVELVL